MLPSPPPPPPSCRRMRRRFRCRTFILAFLLFLFFHSAAAAAAAAAHSHSHSHSSHSPSAAPSLSAAAAAAAPVPTSSSAAAAPLPAPNNSNGSSSLLDPSQTRALSALGASPGPDPCSDPSLSCDSASPFHHIVFLRLQYCAHNQNLPSSAWKILSPFLTSLSFLDCPAPPPQLPPELSASLVALQVVSSLGRSVENAMAPGLPASWLSRFHGLRQLTVDEVEVSSDGFGAAATVSAVFANMSRLQLLALSSANISGPLPSFWPSLDLETLQISGNDLHGPIPPSIGRLRRLASLDLSSANLSGPIPSHIANLSSLQRLDLSRNLLSGPLPPQLHHCASLQYLDLSGNHLSGAVPQFLARMPSLRYVDLSQNRFSGILPFGDAFLRSLNAFKAGGNAALCFNSSIASAKYLPGLQPCDASGRPMQTPESGGPAPAPSPDAVMSEGPAPSGRRGPSKTVLVVAIALASIVALIVVLVVISRCCSGKRA